MNRKTLNKGDKKELHKFWDLTSRRWFFMFFYLLLALILSVYANIKYRAPAPAFLGFILLMPVGLIYLLGLFDNTEVSSFIFVCIFYLLTVFSINYIHYLKAKKGIILKWLIITLILLMMASFAGCVAYLRANGYPIGA